MVPDLPETLLAGREREYVGWFLKMKALSPDTFDDAEVDHYAAAVAADGGLRASSRITGTPRNRRARTARRSNGGT